MGVGPIMISDMSVFQSLTLDEHRSLDRLFLRLLPPVLAFEVVAKLLKQPPKGRTTRTPAAYVQQLADKFLGGGPTVPVEYREACLGNLAGNRVAMTGQVPVAHGRLYQLEDGGTGMMLGLHPLNQAIRRWRSGDFAPLEREFVEVWKKAAVDVRPERFRHTLHQHSVVLYKVDSLSKLRGAVDRAVDDPACQHIWLEWLLREMKAPRGAMSRLLMRWETFGRPPLRLYAPYATHCIRTLLSLEIALRSRLLSWDSNHPIDLQYLFYLPFCMVLTSRDHLHAALAPALLRSNQSFVPGDVLKAELAGLANAELRVRPALEGATLSPEQSQFAGIAPVIARLHRDHLAGGTKALRPDDSLD